MSVRATLQRAMVIVGCLIISMTPIIAQAQIVIRDTEIEQNLHDWTEGVIKAAGMKPEQINMILVQDSNVNAYVAGGANIFINTGLIDLTDNVGQVIGVVAHELGHIEGGHLTRTAQAGKNAALEATLATLLGVGAAIATGDSRAAAAGVHIGQSQGMNSFLAHSRVQESSADQAGYRFMTEAGLSPEGLPSFLDKLAAQELLPSSQQAQYIRTHPLSRDRVESLESKVQKSSLKAKEFPQEWGEGYKRTKAKLMAYTNPQQVFYAYKDDDTSISARYARAIADYRLNQIDRALEGIENLIKEEPNNPYFHEVKGQMLYEFGRIPEAVTAYQKAIDKKPDASLIRMGLAQALIENAHGNTEILQKAINHLKRVEKDEPRVIMVKRLLSTAYGRMGKEPEARVFMAEETLLRGNQVEAKKTAQSALEGLSPESSEYLRAKDIINTVGESDENR